MLISSYSKNNRNRLALLIFSLAGLFMFSLITQVQAKSISLGTTTDVIYTGGSFGVGTGIVGANEKVRIEVPDGYWGLQFTRLGNPVGGIYTNTGNLYLENATGAQLNLNGTNIGMSGNVGIGTSTPGNKLQIVGGGITVSGPASAQAGAYVSLSQETNYAQLQSWGSKPLYINPAGNNVIFNAGNIGIGTTNPTAKLYINPGATPGLISNGSIQFPLMGSAGNVVIMADNAGTLYSTTTAAFFTSYSPTSLWGGTKDATIWNGTSGAGNVGIGTTNPLYKLQVVGTSYLNGQITTALSGVGNRCVYVDATGNLAAKSADCGTATGGDNLGNHIATQNIQLGAYWLSGDGGNEGVFVKADGNVGIGNSNPGVALDVPSGTFRSLAGTVTALGGTGTAIVMADNNGTLFSMTPSAFISNSNVSTLYHVKKWFNPNSNQSISTSGVTVTILNPVANFQFLATMVGSRLTINGESRIIMSYTSSSVVTVDSAYSANYSGLPYTLWGVYGRAVEIASDGSVSTYSETGSMAIQKRTGDTNVYIPNLLDQGSKYYLTSPSLALSQDFPFTWSNSAAYSGTKDVGLRRTAAGALEVYDGVTATAGTLSAYRDLNIRNLYVNGNIGIGITNPAVKLDVVGAVRNTLATTHSLLGGSGNIIVMADNTGTLYSTTTSSFFSNGSLWGGTKNGTIYNGDAGAGNVGIGITNPAYKLQVVGTSYLNGQISTALSGTGNRCVYVDATGNLLAKSADCGTATGGDNLGNHIATQNIQLGNYWLSGDGGNEGVFVTAAGNVGIGTSTPVSALDVVGQIKSRMTNTGNATGVSMGNNGSEQPQVLFNVSDNSARFKLQANGVGSANERLSVYAGPLNNAATLEALVVGGNGNVGVGTTAPTERLQVAGGLKITGGVGGANYTNSTLADYSGGYSRIMAGGSAVGTPGLLQLITMSSDASIYNAAMTIIGNGNVGVGLTNPAYKLDVAGDINLTGTLRINGVAMSSSQWTTNGTSIYYNTGNVGIGITAPTAKLDIAGSLRNSLATTHSLLGGAGNKYAVADNTGTLYQGLLSEVSSAVNVGGGVIFKRTPVANVNYTAQATDYIIAYTSLTANRTVTLPTALCVPGREFVIVNETGSAFSVIVDPEGATTIAGQTTLELDANNSTPAYCNGTNWFIY